MHHRIFVYGSLRSSFGHPAHAYISDHFLPEGPAKVQGKVYDLGDYPGAVPTTEPYFITGELYCLRDNTFFAEAITPLDEYEGLFETPPLYRREKTTAYIDDTTAGTWIYWYNQPIAGKPWIASGDVWQYMQAKSKP